MAAPDPYERAAALCAALEAELKRLGRWRATPLPAAAFENMGAFGENTMTFEQWIQFVLLDRLREIVSERGTFPGGSQLASYAVRAFDDDPDAEPLREILWEIDQLVARVSGGADATEALMPEEEGRASAVAADSVVLGASDLPSVVRTLAGVLPQFEGEALESQLQTFDTFLTILSPVVRKELSALLLDAARDTQNPESRRRIERAASDVARGERAAAPYDHAAAMERYREEHRRAFGPS